MSVSFLSAWKTLTDRMRSVVKGIMIYVLQFVERHVVNVGLLLVGDIFTSGLPLN